MGYTFILCFWNKTKSTIVNRWRQHTISTNSNFFTTDWTPIFKVPSSCVIYRYFIRMKVFYLWNTLMCFSWIIIGLMLLNFNNHWCSFYMLNFNKHCICFLVVHFNQKVGDSPPKSCEKEYNLDLKWKRTPFTTQSIMLWHRF